MHNHSHLQELVSFQVEILETMVSENYLNKVVGVYINMIKTTFLTNKLFLNYKFTSKQRETVNWQLLFALCFEILVKVKTLKKESRLLVWILSTTTVVKCYRGVSRGQNFCNRYF